jgi:hypothetical protein
MKLKSIALTFCALLFAAITCIAQVPSVNYVSQAGVTLFSYTSATATATSSVVVVPNHSALGNLLITTAGITGSPSGCSVALYSVSNASQLAPASPEQTVSFSISTGTHAQTVAALSASDVTTDAIEAIYACSSAYPTAGTITVSFAPINTTNVTVTSGALTVTNPVVVTQTTTGDPCENPQVAKSSVALAISTATTTQLVVPSGTTAVYVCGLSASFGASTTMSLEYGTSSACTGTHALTGVYAPATGSILTLGGAHLVTPGSQGVCAVSTGTGGINGVLTFVQQ